MLVAHISDHAVAAAPKRGGAMRLRAHFAIQKRPGIKCRVEAEEPLKGARRRRSSAVQRPKVRIEPLALDIVA